MPPLLALAALVAQTPIALDVDATDAARGIFHVRETVTASGPITLSYPKWIPGEHGPTGPIFDVVDLHFIQNGADRPWRRNPMEPYTFMVDAQSGQLRIDFEYVAATHSIATRNLARIKWNRLILLPDGNAKAVVRASLKAPDGWSTATALDFDHKGQFETTTAERLIDSPAVIGRYYKSYPIGSPGLPPAALEVFTEKPAELPKEMVEDHARLFREAAAYFGTPHFRHYQFLLTFSDQGGTDGLEHNECSEDGDPFDAIYNVVEIGDLDCHEFSHSWCGKYRRPIGLGDPDYAGPMNDQDLWVYEGFTQFSGVLLAARSGFWTPDQFRDRIAQELDRLENTTGRNWRPLEDTTYIATVPGATNNDWYNRRRGGDYYDEMIGNWLEADGIIRRQTGGQKSIDDFCHLFFGGPNNGPEIRSYNRKDLIAALSAVCPYDWAGFIQTRVLSVRLDVNDGWLERAGWSLTYSDSPNQFATDIQVGEQKSLSVMNGLGISVVDGEIRDVQERSPADTAQLAPGMKVIAVNGAKYGIAAMQQALKDQVKSSAPLQLTVDDYDVVRTIGVDYHGGLKIPHLTRLPSAPDLLGPASQPHAATKQG